jgi:hypothetical protein
MKTILSFFLAFISLNTFAQIGHDLTIFSEDGLKFTVTFNGTKMNDTPLPTVVMNDIHNDYGKAKIEFEDPAIPPIERKILQIKSASNSGGAPESVVYEIKKNKKDELVLRWASASLKKIQPQQTIIIQEAPPQQEGIQINGPGGRVTITPH